MIYFTAASLNSSNRGYVCYILSQTALITTETKPLKILKYQPEIPRLPATERSIDTFSPEIQFKKKKKTKLEDLDGKKKKQPTIRFLKQ